MSEGAVTRRSLPYFIPRLLVAACCFAGAAALLWHCLDQQGSNNTVKFSANFARSLLLIVYGPAIGALAGLGVGLLVNRPIKGVLIGFLLIALPDAAFMGYLSIAVTLTQTQAAWFTAGVVLLLAAVLVSGLFLWFRWRRSNAVH